MQKEKHTISSHTECAPLSPQMDKQSFDMSLNLDITELFHKSSIENVQVNDYLVFLNIWHSSIPTFFSLYTSVRIQLH